MFFDDWGIFKNLIKSRKYSTIIFEKDLDIIEKGHITDLQIVEDRLTIKYQVVEEDRYEELSFTEKQFVSCSDANDYSNTEKYDGIRLLVRPIGWIVLN